ncbi:MAG: DegT/DnrJ/EryC1/StrS family aminotransferase [Desulfobacteraceae bacterium]|nr:MAG: DegT/DnrJ/EryC1/StrS family aminotransferase [Desulfobacteraceae bacterium]
MPNWKVQLFELNFDEQEVEAVSRVIKSGWITMGERIIEFEGRFANYLGHGSRAVAVSNGTAALHMSLLALGITAGDEIIVPALTFVADINVVRMVGATPVPADCTSLYDWNMSPADIEAKITSRTKAVMIVHYAGYPCNMDEIVGICKRHGLYLVEDCAHAPGAEYRGKKCGAFGDMSCFSFFTNKNLSVGEGGMYVTLSDALEQKGRYLRSHGMTTLTLDRHEGRAITYDVTQPGLNYRMDEMRAALGLVQLGKLAAANAERERLTRHYIHLLSDVEGITIPFVDYPNCKPSYHIFPILLDKGIDRLSVINKLKEEGIQSSIHYPSFHEFSAYKDFGLNDTPVATEISKRELTLPLFPTMGFEKVELVVKALKKALHQ